MDNNNHPPYGCQNAAGGGSYYPQQQPLYPPSQGFYPSPMPPPPGHPYQQPPPPGPTSQGYFPNTSQPPPSPGGYGQPGMPPVQPSFPASYPYQQYGSQHQGQTSHNGYSPSPQSTGSFDPSAPQYAQQLSPPQTFGYAPPSPSLSNGYNPQNPPPLPPRSPAAHMSFAPPPVTAISSKPAGTLGRLGARVAGTVQSKVKDYLTAKQENIQSGSLGPKPSYGYNPPSQPWQAPNVGTSSYPASTMPPVSHSPEYQTAPSLPSYNAVNQAISSTTSPGGQSFQEPPPNASMVASASPSTTSASAPPPAPPPPPPISTPFQPQSSAPTPVMAAPSTAPPHSIGISHSDPKPSAVPGTMAPRPENPVAQTTPTTEASRPSHLGQVSEQGPQTVNTAAGGNPTMTWGWNLAFNPASQPLGQFVPQLKLTPMFTEPGANQTVSEPAAQPTAPAAPAKVLESLDSSIPSPPSDESTSRQTVLAELPADEAPRLPDKVTLQAASQSSRSSSVPAAKSISESAPFRPYRPTALSKSSESSKDWDGKSSPVKLASDLAPRPLSTPKTPANPNQKPKPTHKTFQPYRAPEIPSQENRDPDQISGVTPAPGPGRPTTANSLGSTSICGSKTSRVSSSASIPPTQQTAERPLPLGPYSQAGTPNQELHGRGPTSAKNSITALGDLITDHLQNLTISSTPVGSPKVSISPGNTPGPKTCLDTHSSSTSASEHILQSAYQDEYCPYPMLTTPMLVNGRSSVSPDLSRPQPSRFCFGADPAHFPRSYYRHPEALSFPICTWCFDTYIAHTSLASAFPVSLVVAAASVVCGFHVPRITKCLWPAAAKSGDLTDLVRFMEKRYPTLPTASENPDNAEATTASEVELKIIKPCKRGGQHVHAHEGYTWYRASTPSPSAPDLMVCEACYEDLVLAMPAFAAHFTGPLPHPEAEILACMIAAHPYLQRALLRYGGTAADWEGFIQAANMRLQLTQNASTMSCDGISRRVASCRWWTLKGYENIISSLPSDPVAYSPLSRTQGRNHFIICESCYLDAVVGTRFEQIFEMVSEPPLEDIPTWDTERYNLDRWCTYSAGKNHAIVDAFLAANMRKLSSRTLYLMLEEISAKPRCGQVPAGIHDGLFYNFPSAARVDDFGICEAHYASTVKGFGLEQFFSDSPVQVPGQAFCAFHPALVRVDQWIHKLNEAIDTGDFTIYQDNVRKFVAIPNCPRREAVENRRWYGWPDCAICPDCFEQFASGTKLAENMPWKNEPAEYLVICSMYSPRQREMYNRACDSGDVEGLLAACRERTKIWNRTVPRMTVLAAQKSIANGQAMLAAQLAHSHASSNAISFGDDGTRWTTSSGNSYQSYNGVLAEKYRNEAEALEAKVRGLDPTSESIHLAVLWDSVE